MFYCRHNAQKPLQPFANPPAARSDSAIRQSHLAAKTSPHETSSFVRARHALRAAVFKKIAARQFIAVANKKPPTPSENTSPVRRHFADKRRLGSRRDLFCPPNQFLPRKPAHRGGGSRNEVHLPIRHAIIKASNARQPFRVRSHAPAPPVSTRTASPLPCSESVRLPPLLLGPLSQTTAFEPPQRHLEAPVITPAAAVLPRLGGNRHTRSRVA